MQAGHADDERQAKGTVTEFRAQKPGNQRMMCFELAMAIASVRALPSRRAARGEAEHDEALRSAVSDIMDEMPADMVERTGRMYALSRRAILAYIDRDAETLAAVIDRVATWDDDPGRTPSPQFRFEYPNQQALAFANQLLHLGEMAGIHITNREAGDSAAPLIDRYAPSEHMQAARELITALRTAGKSGVDFNQAVANGPAGLVAFAAMAAGLTQNRRLPLPKERTRLNLINESVRAKPKHCASPIARSSPSATRRHSPSSNSSTDPTTRSRVTPANARSGNTTSSPSQHSTSWSTRRTPPRPNSGKHSTPVSDGAPGKNNPASAPLPRRTAATWCASSPSALHSGSGRASSTSRDERKGPHLHLTIPQLRHLGVDFGSEAAAPRVTVNRC
ncbi:hypothetical protein ABT373_38095 [Streptomyces sp. NPDC000070]|uniref:hypothetical protein n=1 Tax=Streptomyces sp. NPDC000070 TaxID=3154240 RepID=UPI00332637F8